MTDMNKINFEALESVTGGKDVQVKNPSASSTMVTGSAQQAER